jgi:predicted signal transduction protein with EAL and GGDEF domain
LKTVAEGVETAEQLEILRELGCGTIQGYLIGRPATALDISTWLVDKRPKLPNALPAQENERPGANVSESPRKVPSQHRKHR